jgi:hypothetical protein
MTVRVTPGFVPVCGPGPAGTDRGGSQIRGD